MVIILTKNMMEIMSLWVDNVLYDMQQLMTNKTNIEAFDIFNSEYGTKALSVCPELKNITIDAVCNYDSAHLAELNLNPNDAFAYYFYYQASPKNAEIVVNKDVIKRKNITIDDTLAAIAHEIGHIISIEKHGDSFTELPAEVLADEYACRIGLKEQLIILLKKMICCGEYFDFQVKWLEKRRVTPCLSPCYHIGINAVPIGGE